MPLHFTVLASGSAANASLLEADGFGVLIDAGLGPRQLAARLPSLWERVHVVLLTHTHGDHWRETTLVHLRRRRIPLYCHAEHHALLENASPAFAELHADGLVRAYEVNEHLEIGGVRCLPFRVSHDGGLTCGFRLESSAGLLGYAADLGCWGANQVRALADVDVLALEFNHDAYLERSSGRSPHLIARVLSDHGHLSNDQAAQLVRAVLQESEPGRLQHLVQLHLSRECNRPHLARQVAEEALADYPDIRVHTADQEQPLSCITVEAPLVPAPCELQFAQGWLFGFE
jgi:phosphoribosyl 1,2-cyclic phosphodiesterase